MTAGKDLHTHLPGTDAPRSSPDTAREQQQPHELFLLQALEVELSGRAERARERRRRAARLPAHKTLDSFDFSFQPSLLLPPLRQLACLTFVQTTTNVIFLGPPGVGKTHLATALAVQALEAGHSVVFSTLSQLPDGLEFGSPISILARPVTPLCTTTRLGH